MWSIQKAPHDQWDAMQLESSVRTGHSLQTTLARNVYDVSDVSPQ